jgi:DNA gyrase subunit A
MKMETLLSLKLSKKVKPVLEVLEDEGADDEDDVDDEEAEDDEVEDDSDDDED